MILPLITHIIPLFCCIRLLMLILLIAFIMVWDPPKHYKHVNIVRLFQACCVCCLRLFIFFITIMMSVMFIMFVMLGDPPTHYKHFNVVCALCSLLLHVICSKLVVYNVYNVCNVWGSFETLETWWYCVCVCVMFFSAFWKKNKQLIWVYCFSSVYLFHNVYNVHNVHNVYNVYNVWGPSKHHKHYLCFCALLVLFVMCLDLFYNVHNVYNVHTSHNVYHGWGPPTH